MSSGPGPNDHLVLGDWNAVCYECGRKQKASTMKRHWQGYYLCPDHWEPRQPQDFVRGTKDTQQPPWTQPMPADVFVAGAPDIPIAQPNEYPIYGDD